MKLHICIQICLAYLVTSPFLSFVSATVLRHTSSLRNLENSGKRVDGGQIVENGRYPYIATISSSCGTNCRIREGYGTLIAPSWVISDMGVFRDVTDMNDFYVEFWSGGVSIKVKTVIMNRINPVDATNDEDSDIGVVLLELEEETTTPHISSIANTKTPKETTVIGIGFPNFYKFYFDSIMTGVSYSTEEEENFTQEFYADGSLREVSLQTISDDQCFEKFNEFYMELKEKSIETYGMVTYPVSEAYGTNMEITDFDLACAYNKDEGLCTDDYGVPIIMKGSETDNDILVGVGVTGTCGYSVSFFHEIHLFREWISETITVPPDEGSDEDPDEGSDEDPDEGSDDLDEDISAVIDALATLLTFFCN